MADTYNVGAINAGLQNLAREIYGTGRGSLSPAREQLYRERILTEGIKRDQEEIERERRRAEDATVAPMIEAFTSMYQPLVPTKMAPTGQTVPMPVARPTAEVMAVENEVGSPAHDAFIAETTRQYPSFASKPLVDPQALRALIEGNVRTGLAKKDMTGVNGAIADTLATMITAANGITEEDAFRGNALRGESTPQNQSYTAAGADAVARRNHDFNVEKKNLDADNRLAIAQGRNDVTMRGQDVTAETQRRGQDINSETQRRGQDVTTETQRRGQDINSETQRRGQDINADTQRGGQSIIAETMRRGQDITSETQRRGQDITADTQRGGQIISADTIRRGQDITSTDRQRGQDITSDTIRRGQDITSADRQRGQDITSETQRRGQDVNAATAAMRNAAEAAYKLPRSIPQTPKEMHLFEQYATKRIRDYFRDDTGKVEPNDLNAVKRAYDDYIGRNQRMSPDRALEQAIEDVYGEGTVEKPWFGSNSLKAKPRTEAPAAPPPQAAPPPPAPQPAAPQAPQAAAQPARDPAAIRARAAEVMRQWDERTDLSPEEIARGKAKVQARVRELLGE